MCKPFWIYVKSFENTCQIYWITLQNFFFFLRGGGLPMKQQEQNIYSAYGQNYNEPNLSKIDFPLYEGQDRANLLLLTETMIGFKPLCM